jgi:tetratricopeptide (TPR) repeat protein
MESGSVQAADAILDDLLERSRDLGLPLPMWQALLNRGARELRLGDAEAAEATADEALALAARAGMVESMGAYGGQLFNIRAHQGRLGELAELFAAAAEENASIDALRAAVIAVCLATGNVDEARRRYRDERAAGFDFTFQYSWFQCMGELSDAAVELGDHEGAATLYDRLSPYAERLSFVHAVPPRPMARSLGRLAALLGRHDDAEHHFATALDLCERLRAPFWRARTLLDHAESIEARGGADANRAREMATTASALALEYGCAGLSTRGAALLARLPAGA